MRPHPNPPQNSEGIDWWTEQATYSVPDLSPPFLGERAWQATAFRARVGSALSNFSTPTLCSIFSLQS